MSHFCYQCGQPLEATDRFCIHCGAKIPDADTPVAVSQAAQIPPAAPPPAAPPATLPVAAVSQAPAGAPPVVPPAVPPAVPPVAPAYQAPPAVPPAATQSGPRPAQAPGVSNAGRKKVNWLLVVLVGVIVLGGVGGVIALLGKVIPGNPKATTEAVGTTVEKSPNANDFSRLSAFPGPLAAETKVKVTCHYDAPNIIIPANYRSLPYIVFLRCWTSQGQTDVLVQAEIPGFTQVYEKKVTVTRAETEMNIHPPLLGGISASLNSAKDAQLKITVKDQATGEIYLQESAPVRLYSFYDMQWVDSAGTPYYENILAWVTPEAPEIRTLLRQAADSCSEITNGQMESIVGYQEIGNFSHEDITYIQTLAIMHAMAARLNVKYIMAPFSSTDTNLQRIATPAQVINSQGGLCIETAVTLASALQATNMHAFIIILPGHAQVAVESWTGSGQYYLVETTALTDAANFNYDNVVNYKMTQDDWAAYLSEDGMLAIDCNLARELNITPVE